MSAQSKVTRAGCYCRISSDPKDRREGVDRQRDDTSALCEIKGWTVADYYIDNDRSASNGKDRPAWDRLLGDIAEGKIDAIAAWDQDRGWRMMHELESLRKFFTGLGRPVQLATTGQGDIDLYSPTGVLTAQIKTAVSEHEIAMMKVRMRRAAKAKAERGDAQWRNAFGYKTDGSRTPDPVTAPLVQRVYAHVIAGGSISDGVRMLNAEGAFGLSGKPWTPSTLSLFLRAPRNAGLRSHNDEIVGQGNWPGLVDESTWRTTQAILSAPGRAPGRKTVRKHLLTGVLRCGKPGCDGYLAGQWVMQSVGGRPGRPKAGEVRLSRKEQPKRPHSITYQCKKCRGVSVHADLVEPLIYRMVSARLAEPDAVDLLRSKQFDPDEAKKLDDERQTLYGQIRAAESEYDEGIIDGRRLAARKDRVAVKLAAIEARQMDSDMVRVLDGLPLGTPEVADAIKELSGDRLRAVINVLVEFTVNPVGKGHRPNGDRFDPDRIAYRWL